MKILNRKRVMSNTNVIHTRTTTSQRVNKISPSGIRKFFDLISSTEGIISLGIGEPDFATPWHIRQAAISSLEQGDTMYTSNYGLPELREELARHLESLYGVKYDPNTELLITVGVSEALDLAMRATLDPGDEVIMADPAYVAYEACVVLAGGIPVPIPTNQENRFVLRASDIETRINERAKVILTGYPSNPTGAVMNREELLGIADLARKHDLLVVSDEIYDRLVYGAKHTCFASLPEMRERTILLGGFSKAYAMTGWRVGYAAAKADIIESMMKVHQYTTMCASIMGQKAAIEALKSGEDAVQEMVQSYDWRRQVMLKGFRDIGLTCFEPHGAFYTFPSIKSSGLSSEEFAEGLLKEEKVVVVPGSAFGKCGEGHVRCCYATSMDNIEEAIERMGRFLTRHRAV